MNDLKKAHWTQLVDNFALTGSYWCILLFPVILRLPIGLGFRYNIVVRAATLLPLLITIFFQLLYIKQHELHLEISYKNQSHVTLFFLLWLAAIIRTMLGVNLGVGIFIALDLVILVLVISLVFFGFGIIPGNRAFILRRCVVAAFGLYITLNLILYGLGVESGDQIYLAKYPSQILTMLGFPGYRVLFPMTKGINYYGLFAGSVLVSFMILLRDKRWIWMRVAGLLIVLLALVSILLTDSRGALLFSLMTVLLFSVFRGFPRALVYCVVIASILPPILTPLISSMKLDAFDFLARQDSQWEPASQFTADNDDCETRLTQVSGILSNRPVIWGIVLRELAQPKFIHIIGYGYRGHYISGISSQYSCLFKSYALSDLASTHNLWLQLVVDLGYVGTIVSLWFIDGLVAKLSRLFIQSRDYVFMAMQGVLVYVILIGSLEASLSPDFNMLFIFICLISIISVFDIQAEPDKSTG